MSDNDNDNEIDKLCSSMRYTNLEERNWEDLCKSYTKCSDYIEFYRQNRYFPMETNYMLVEPIQYFLKKELELKTKYYKEPFREEYIEEDPNDIDFRIIVEELSFFIQQLRSAFEGENEIMFVHDKLNELLIYDKELTKHLLIYIKRVIRDSGSIDSYPTPFDDASDYEEEFISENYDYFYYD